ncbi:protein DD3-3-like [Clytia hemisphaerica]|uniref:Protein DD3-3 n=1 Tax=Clytia hemisphaerica TaxID=252671 RepID=A0A7M5WQA4_9CNID
MRRTTLSLAVLATILVWCNADIYMHNPRGSNNRLNEKSATRANNNRVFDSQNNARGGYNVGDRTDQQAGNNKNNQYQMEYFISGNGNNNPTKLLIEWTNQHGCGGNQSNSNDRNPHKLNCDIIIQYMDVDPTDEAYKETKTEFRDGTNTQTQNFNANAGEQTDKDGKRTFTETQQAFGTRKAGSIDQNKVYQDPFEWYDKCDKRPRNKGLFTADQNVKADRATHTRQNPGGTRRGYECPEERDYWPYWHPTGWKDIAILTNRVDKCDDFFKKESFNVKPKGECVENWPNSNNHRHYSGAETPAKCTALGGEWVDFHNYLEIDTTKNNKGACEAAGYKWGIPYRHSANNRKAEACMIPLKAPECKPAPWSRHNHLGNGENDAEPNNYEWILPHFPKLTGDSTRAFVLRIRYNISTEDYDPYNTDSSSNGDAPISPVTNNPLVDVGSHGSPLQLAINTAQFGRTFEDRSHTSLFIARPAGVNGVIHNLNVRGKRGNIVQTFPAVEYDYFPTSLKMEQVDHVHIQWTGSNSHNNGKNGGDGQTGDAGQGTGGTDRSNMCAYKNKNDNFPMVSEDPEQMTKFMKIVWQRKEGKPSSQMDVRDIYVKLASGGYYDCYNGCTHSVKTKAQLNNLLNNAPASFSGLLAKYTKKGTFYFLCTRNNNFTNRSQKGEIIVS